MIRRNVANQPILIGPLLAITNGDAQTSGASIIVRKDGVNVPTPGGTLTHVSSGVWEYIPTQDETDIELMLGLILIKTGAAPSPLNVTVDFFNQEVPGLYEPGTAGYELGRVNESDGTGAIEVNHDFGGDDNLLYRNTQGAPIDGATIQVYLSENYNAGRRSRAYVVARSDTGVDGRWLRPVMLSPGTYTLVFFKVNTYGPDVTEITVG